MISGNGFIDGNTAVNIDTVPCVISSITDALTIECVTGPHVEGTYDVAVSVNSQQYPTPFTFEYSDAITPTLTSMSTTA